MDSKLLIFNPVSGKNNNKITGLGEIIGKLTKEGQELVVYQTQSKGDAEEYIVQNAAKYKLIVCCGGDGTLHEVVNGMMRVEAKGTLGYIPMGSTNDYAKNLGIDRRNAIKYILNDKSMQIDVGQFNHVFFNYVAAFGAFTNVPYETSQEIKNALGYMAYLLEGAKHVSDIKAYHVKCVIDDRTIEDDFVIGLVTNAFSVAGMKSKNAGVTRLDDGLLEYIFIKMPQNLIELQTIISALLSSDINERYVYHGQAKRMVLSSVPMAWTLDGENGGVHEQVEIKTCYRAINMIVGKNFE